MKIQFFIFAFAMAIGLGSVAQGDNGFRPSVSVSYVYFCGSTYHQSSLPQHIITDNGSRLYGHAVMLDADLWSISKHLSAGVHLAGWDASYMNSSTNEFISTPAFHYGIDFKCHLMPDSRRMDLCLAAQLGSYWSAHISPSVEYGASLRLAYRIAGHWGVFAETGWGRYYFSYRDSNGHVLPVAYPANTTLKGGITYRF